MDDEVSEVMVNGPGSVFVERRGLIEQVDAPELDAAAVLRGGRPDRPAARARSAE